jgi:hypothetical protein
VTPQNANSSSSNTNPIKHITAVTTPFNNTLVKKLSPPPQSSQAATSYQSPRIIFSSNSTALFEPINSPTKEALLFSNLTKSASPPSQSTLETTLNETKNQTESSSSLKTNGVVSSFEDSSVDPAHTCQANSSRAMIECEKCGCFSHVECVFTKKINNNSIKVCSECFKLLNQSTSNDTAYNDLTTSNVNSNSNDNDENTNGSNENNAL